MNGVLDFGVHVVVFVQNLGVWLLRPMELLSLIGGATIFLALIPLLYWCVDADEGLRLSLLLLFSEGINDIFKVLFHGPRPYWYSSQVKALAAEGTFGLPSGHAQRSLVVLGALAAWLKDKWIWATAVALIFLIGLSRLYLGVHFPTDVLLGWLIGLALLWVLLHYEQRLTGWFGRRSPGAQVLFGLLASLVLLAAGTAVRLALSGWQIPAVWLVNAARAGGEPPAPLDAEFMIFNLGTFFGMITGAVILRQQGGFAAAKGDLWQKAARFVLGLLGLAVLWFGLGLIVPKRANLLSYILLFLQYTLVGIWFSGLAPEMFVRLGLASRT